MSRRNLVRSFALLACTASIGAFPATALAGDSAAAQALFDDATRLLAQRRLPEACAKFQESQRQDPGLGTLYHFADCEERLGKSATAWAAFLEVASEAKAQGQSARADAARDRAAALAPRLPRLTFDPGVGPETAGLTLTRDGEPVGRGEWSTAIPVDPGSHVIEARAPGKLPWATTVNARESARLVISVPRLSDGVAPPASATIATPASVTTISSGEVPATHRGNGQRAAGIVLTALGVAGLGVGAYFGVESLVHHDDANAHCNGNLCDSTGVSLRSDAQQAGTGATIALAAGGAVLLAGIITYATAPSRDSSSLRPTVSIGPGSFTVSGRF